MKVFATSILALAAVGASAAEDQRGSTAKRSALEVIRKDAKPATRGSPANFIGDVAVRSNFQQQSPARVGGATVTFQPGARTAWHTHPLGQTLIVTAGVGWVQIEGEPRQEIRVGDVALIPPGAKHWHGATTASAMTHIAIAEALDGKVVTWLEQVSEKDYRATGSQ